MQIVVLAGGVGGSRFVAGVRQAYPQAEITVVVNTGDDITLHGLRVCPDLDTMMYTLGGANDRARGWGRAEETWRVKEELAAYGAEPSWFSLGDLDLATHIVRTQMLEAGYPLSQITEALCTRWLPDSMLLRLLPMSDDRVETHIVIADDQTPWADFGGSPDGPTPRRAIHFQEYWVRLHAEPEALGVALVGIDSATPAPGVTEAIAVADLVLLAPSNPVVSIGPILALPGLRAAVVAAAAPVIGFSGIVAGAPLLGMAHRLLPAVGIATDAGAVGRHYGARADGGVLDLWVMDDSDAELVRGVSDAGLAATVTDLIMRDPEATARFVAHAVGALR